MIISAIGFWQIIIIFIIMETSAEDRQKEIQNKLNQEIKNKMTQREFPLLQGMSLKGSIGGVLGYCAGTFAKQVSQIAIWYAGLTTCLLGWLSWCQYIKINWRKIDSDIFHFVSQAQDPNNSVTKYVKKMISHYMPLMGGFSGAFYYAFKHGA